MIIIICKLVLFFIGIVSPFIYTKNLNDLNDLIKKRSHAIHINLSNYRILLSTKLLQYQDIQINYNSSVTWDDMSAEYDKRVLLIPYLPLVREWKYIENVVIDRKEKNLYQLEKDGSIFRSN